MVIDKFTIQTQDSIAITRDKLTRKIDNRYSLFEMHMHGEVSKNAFRLYRVAKRRIPLTTMNGWFEDVRSGTVVHLELEVKSAMVIGYLLFILLFSTHVWQIIINNSCKNTGMYMIIIIMFVLHIYSFQAEKIFYRKKLPQIFS